MFWRILGETQLQRSTGMVLDEDSRLVPGCIPGFGGWTLPVEQRAFWSISIGIGSVAIAVLAAYLTQQTPWMRFGMLISYFINGPACAVLSGVIALILGGIVLTFVQSSPPHAIEAKAAYEAYLAEVDRIYKFLVFGCGASAFWGFLFGSWFAMRRDKYFVDPIMS